MGMKTNKQNMKRAIHTIASELLKKIRAARGDEVKITPHYWGTASNYENGRYKFWDYRPKFGGMTTCRGRTISAGDILNCGDDFEKLSELISPRRDTSPGDPQNYATNSSDICELLF